MNKTRKKFRKELLNKGALEVVVALGAQAKTNKKHRRDKKQLKTALEEANRAADVIASIAENERETTLAVMQRISNGLSTDKKSKQRKAYPGASQGNSGKFYRKL